MEMNRMCSSQSARGALAAMGISTPAPALTAEDTASAIDSK